MTDDEMAKLNVGDIVRHASGGDGYVVTNNSGSRATAVRTVEITNPSEWVLVSKSECRQQQPTKALPDPTK